MVQDSARTVWGFVLAGPILFLLAIVGVSGWLGGTGTPPDLIGQEVPKYASHMLLGVLLVLALLVVWRLPLAALWARADPTRTLADLGWGAAVGVVLAVAYLWALAPLMEILQRSLGDYVPPGAVADTIAGQIGLFFIANVLLAPWVEETIYRGLALRGLTPRYGVARAVVISCLAFGLLHWTGGIWYMVLTGGVAGAALTALALWRGGLLAPFAAHLALNVIEFAAAAAST